MTSPHYLTFLSSTNYTLYQVGLENLDPKLRGLLPEVNLGVARHREQFFSAIGATGATHQIPMEGLERMYQVRYW